MELEDKDRVYITECPFCGTFGEHILVEKINSKVKIECLACRKKFKVKDLNFLV